MSHITISPGEPTGEKIVVAYCWLCGEPAIYAPTYKQESGGITTGLVSLAPLNLCEKCRLAILKALRRVKKGKLV